MERIIFMLITLCCYNMKCTLQQVDFMYIANLSHWQLFSGYSEAFQWGFTRSILLLMKGKPMMQRMLKDLSNEIVHTCVCVCVCVCEWVFIRLKEKVKESESRSVVSDLLRPHGLYSPWNSPGQNTGVGSHSLLQGIFPTQGSNPGLLHCWQIPYQLSHQFSWTSITPFRLSAKFSVFQVF